MIKVNFILVLISSLIAITTIASAGNVTYIDKFEFKVIGGSCFNQSDRSEKLVKTNCTLESLKVKIHRTGQEGSFELKEKVCIKRGFFSFWDCISSDDKNIDHMGTFVDDQFRKSVSAIFVISQTAGSKGKYLRLWVSESGDQFQFTDNLGQYKDKIQENNYNLVLIEHTRM